MLDFSLQMPAVTITYMFLLGLGVAQSRSARGGGHQPDKKKRPVKVVRLTSTE
jgi:hypothetical protein